MKTAILKLNDLAILQDGDESECDVVTGYRSGNPSEIVHTCGSLSEAAVLFCDIFGMRVQRWASKKEAEQVGHKEA